MQYTGKKQKSFLQSFTWVAMLLLAMGVVFLGVAAVMQLVPITPENLQSYRNGVLQPSADESVRTFRLVFLLTLGSVGLGLAAAGCIVAVCQGARRTLARRLKSEGARLTATAMDCAPSYAVRVNYRYMMRLQCAYKGPDGVTYIFKSGYLRVNPLPYLDQGKVTVYHDRNNMARYFVDVDGSAGLNTKIVEL